MAKASDFEAEVTSRGEELKALAMAKKAVVENTSGAGGQTYSFFQSSSLITSKADLLRFEAVRYIKGMVTDMIAKLEQEAADAADLKGWCDKEIAEATEKKEDTSAEVEKLTTKLDSATARSKTLKEDTSAEVEKLTTKLDSATA